MPSSNQTLPSLSDLGFSILQAAVRLARDEQIADVAKLKSRLATIFPGQTEEVQNALRFWALCERAAA